MAATLREKYIAALTKMGEREVKRTFKYIVFTMTGGRYQYYYLGKNGSIRVGNTIACSFPASAAFKDRLVRELEG